MLIKSIWSTRTVTHYFRFYGISDPYSAAQE